MAFIQWQAARDLNKSLRPGRGVRRQKTEDKTNPFIRHAVLIFQKTKSLFSPQTLSQVILREADAKFILEFVLGFGS